MKSIAFSVLAFLILAAVPARADTMIHAEYSATYDRLRPNPYKGINLKNSLDLTLSEKNTVTETSKRAAGQVSDSHRKANTLGSAGWNVVEENKLQKIVDLPQNVTEMTVTVDGSNCKFDIQFKLKPGFKEFAFKKITDGKIGYFTQPVVQTASCSIR